MSTGLGPRPEPRIEPGERPPGGVDAVAFGDGVVSSLSADFPVARDADPDDNPSTDDTVPDALRTGEDTDTEATKADEAGQDVTPEEESPA